MNRKEKIKELKFIWLEHLKANDNFDELLKKVYGERNFIMMLAEVFDDAKKK